MIMKIEGTGPIRTAQPLKRAGKARGTDSASFTQHLDESPETEGTAGLQGSNALGHVANVFGIQEVDDALSRAAKGKLRAQDILDRLEDLRLGILNGCISRDGLQRLSSMVSTHRPEITDPKLGEILDEIDLRAQVELAKLSGL